MPGTNAKTTRGDVSLARQDPRTGLLVNLMLLAALALHLVGVFAPMLTLSKFFVFANTHSLYSALVQLFDEGHWGLFLLLGLFSVAMPLAKLALMAKVWNLEPAHSNRHRRRMAWIAHYGKWSMLDVFVVAVLVVTVKLSAIADTQVHYGVYAFAASVILTMLVTQWILSMSQVSESRPAD